MDINEASINLANALGIAESGQAIECKFKEKLDEILEGNHLTFRYICLTAILAKYTDSNIHPRALQAGAGLIGAYDARTLCHKVVVPFERSRLEGRIGASNEPFLNKPARFSEVSLNNSVRRGRDQRLLTVLYKFLEALNKASREVVFSCLVYGLEVVLRRSSKIAVLPKLPDIEYSYTKVMDVIEKFLQQSFGGQASVAVFGAVIKCIYSRSHNRVVVHPPNQAGSSSNEVGDIDISAAEYFLAVEVKDRDFSKADIEHAVRKVNEAGHSRLVFAMGPKGSTEECVAALIAKYADLRVDLAFTKVANVVSLFLLTQTVANRKFLLQMIALTLTEMRANDDARQGFDGLIGKSFGSASLFT